MKGFTMIEMLLCMGIFSILLIVLLQIFTAILSVHAQSQTTSAIDQEGNYLLSRMSYDIHQASHVPGSTLGTASSTIDITDDAGLNMTYSLDGKNINLKNNTTSYTSPINGEDVTVTGNFTTLGSASNKLSVKISLILTSKVTRVGGLKSTRTFETTIQTR